MTKEKSKKELIRKSIETGFCPLCGGELIYKSNHERDSTYDETRCSKCTWSYIEIETWDLD